MLCGASEAPLFPTFAETFDNARALARDWDEPSRGQPAVRPPPQRLRAGRGLGVAGAGTGRARRRARRPGLRRPGRLRRQHRRLPPDRAATRTAPVPRPACGRRWPTPGSRPTTSATSTPTAPRPNWATSPRRAAIGQAFGEARPPVSSTKALTGHMLGTSGVVEAAISAIAVNSGTLPPTYNLDDPDPDCELNHICDRPRLTAVQYAMSNSFGFGGQNVALLFGRSATPRHHPAVPGSPRRRPPHARRTAA